MASGGIVPKMSLGFAMDSARLAAATMDSYDGAAPWSERLCVDCPLTGEECRYGYRYNIVARFGAHRKTACATNAVMLKVSGNRKEIRVCVVEVAVRGRQQYCQVWLSRLEY